MKRNIRYNNLHGAMQALVLNMFQPFLGILAIKLGGSNTVVALIAALPALTSALVVIPGAFWLERMPRRKMPTAVLFLASRLFLILLALIPLFTRDTRAGWLAALVGLMSLPMSIATVSWQALFAEVFPPEQRAAVFARRNLWMSLTGLAPTLLVGLFLDHTRFPLGYQVVFLAAFAVSLLEIFFLYRLREPEEARLMPTRARRWTEIRKQKLFWRFTLVSLAFYFPWQMGWPLFTIYQVRYLGATNLWMAFFAITNTISQVATFTLWGRWAEKRGTVPMLVWAAAGLALTPAFFAIATTLWFVSIFNLLIGFFAAGAVLLFFNGLLEVAPAEDRAAYIAYNTVLVNLSAFVAPLVANLVNGAVGIKWALVVTALARGAGALAIALWLMPHAQQPAQALADHVPPSRGKGPAARG